MGGPPPRGVPSRAPIAAALASSGAAQTRGASPGRANFLRPFPLPFPFYFITRLLDARFYTYRYDTRKKVYRFDNASKHITDDTYRGYLIIDLSVISNLINNMMKRVENDTRIFMQDFEKINKN